MEFFTLSVVDCGHLVRGCLPLLGVVKTGSSQSGTDERGKCNSVGLSAVCPSNEATIHSVVVAVV